MGIIFLGVHYPFCKTVVPRFGPISVLLKGTMSSINLERVEKGARPIIRMETDVCMFILILYFCFAE